MQTYEQLKKRKCIALQIDERCSATPMFVGSHIDTGENAVACMGHVYLLGDPGYEMIEAVGAKEEEASHDS